MFLSQTQLKRYQECIAKTVQWAYSRYDKILEETDLQSHYKAPAFWAAVGDAAMAGRHRQIICDRFLRSDGDFRMAEDVKGFVQFACTTVNQYIYPNGWLIVGMQKSGAYDVVQKALEFVLRFQDPRHGGFYFAFDPKSGQIDKSLMDSSSTSSAGMALLMAGRLGEARLAGDFILRLLELQPQPDQYYFSCMRPDGALHTDVFATEDQWSPDSRKQKCLSAQSDGLNELTWLIGKPTKFLTRLYTATGEAKYLQGAKKAFFFFHKLHPNAWKNYASCKTMWAGAELYRITGETIFAETATRLLDFYCQTQAPSGSWVHTLWYKSEEEQAFSWTADITWEYGAEFSDVVYDLCAR
jgi:hypothetical protein